MREDRKLGTEFDQLYCYNQMKIFWNMVPGVYQITSITSRNLNIIKLPPFLSPIPDTLLIQITTQNFRVLGNFLKVQYHHP